MKRLRTLLALASTFALLAATVTRAGADADPGQITSSIGRVMEQFHYSRHKLDQEFSKKTLLRYIDTLDYAHMVFTQQDIDAFVAKYGDALDDDILLGNPTPAYEIFDLYRKRMESRIAKVKQWLADEKFTFKSDHTLLINRQKAPWPKDEAEAEQLWHDQVEGEYLTLKLAEKATEPPLKVLNRRYDNLLRNLHEQTNRDAVNQFLSALAQTYDPHSEYMSKEEYQNFLVMMKLSLVGIGAVLKKNDDGYTKIMELVVGGPADKEGHLKVGDRIVAVAQGDGEWVEVVDMKIDKVVSLIRGKKGTKVRLLVIPTHADPSTRKIVEITRDKVEMKDQEAKAYLIERPDANGKPEKIGWITIPSFYGDVDSGAKSTTDDVRILLKRLKKEGISGLVIDIRRNGGGYLTEATRLTGLFIKKGPVVQVKDANGKIDVLSADENDATYDGPLVILTSTLSASASEIFAGALQDYGRAVIVGDHHTFGKGTVQQLIPVDRFLQFLSGGGGEGGALKLTIQKFYRVAGGSTQFRGVTSDVALPSLFDRDDIIGESALKNPLPYDEVPPADYRKTAAFSQPLFLDELRTRSAARVAGNPEFKYIDEDIARQKETFDGNKISLNEQTRRSEMAKRKTEIEKRKQEREKRKSEPLTVYALTLDNVNQPLQPAVNDGKKRNSMDQWVEPTPEAKQKAKAEAKAEASATPTPSPTPAKSPAKADKKASKGSKTKTPAASEDVAEDPEDDTPDTDSNAPVVDATRMETLNIISDLIDLRRLQNTQNTAKASE